MAQKRKCGDRREGKHSLGAEVCWVTRARGKGDSQDSGLSPSGSTGILGAPTGSARVMRAPMGSIKVMESPAIN